MKKRKTAKRSIKKRSLTSQISGRSKRSIKADKARKAKSPGKRRTKSGSYYEDRPNRSDLNKKTRI